jgi:hypothetical protein
MKEKVYSTSDWMIMFVVGITIVIFLWILLSSVPMAAVAAKQQEEEVMVVDIEEKYDGSDYFLTRDEEKVEGRAMIQMVSGWMRRAFEKKTTSTTTISLGKDMPTITSVRIDKTFFIYDCRITFNPTKRCFVLTILMELPPLHIFINGNEEYSKYYPLLNPYIHVVELSYLWKATSDGTMKTTLTLDKIKVFPVDWKMNRYNAMYLDNSQLGKILCLPKPIEINNEEELRRILMETNLFATLPVESEIPFTMSSSSSKSSSSTMTTKVRP